MAPPMLVGPCHDRAFIPFWKTDGNDFTDFCLDPPIVLGTLNEAPLRIVTNGEDRIFITEDGKVGIGTEPEAGAVDGYRLFVEDGIATRDVLVKHGVWPDYVFDKDYPLMPFKELRSYLNLNKHLPGIPSADVVQAKGGLEVGDTQKRLVQVVEEQALYILQLEERLNAMEQRLKALETSQH
jgi:hypothetical protein